MAPEADWATCVTRQRERVRADLDALKKFAKVIPAGWRSQNWWRDVVLWLSARWPKRNMEKNYAVTMTSVWTAMPASDGKKVEKFEEAKATGYEATMDAFAFAYALQLREKCQNEPDVLRIQDYVKRIQTLMIIIEDKKNNLSKRRSSVRMAKAAISESAVWRYWEDPTYDAQSFEWVVFRKPGWRFARRYIDAISQKAGDSFQPDDSLFPSAESGNGYRGSDNGPQDSAGPGVGMSMEARIKREASDDQSGINYSVPAKRQRTDEPSASDKVVTPGIETLLRDLAAKVDSQAEKLSMLEECCDPFLDCLSDDRKRIQRLEEENYGLKGGVRQLERLRREEDDAQASRQLAEENRRI